MLAKPSLSRVAATEIRELREIHGVEPTLDEILWLHALGQRIETPDPDDPHELIGSPIRAGHVWLWPMTITAYLWWRRGPDAWFADSPALALWCLAYALAHGRDPDALAKLTGPTRTKLAVFAWVWRCGCTQAELENAVMRALGDDDAGSGSAADEVKRPQWGNILADLSAMTGQPIEYYTTRPMDLVLRMFRRAIDIQIARAGGGPPDNDDAALTRAIRDMTTARLAIIAAHKEPNEPSA